MPTWLKVEQIKPFPLAPCDAIYTQAAATVKEILGIPMPGFAYHYQDYGIEFCIANEDRAELGRRILERIADKKFTDRVVKTGLKACDDMLALAEPFTQSASFTNAELADRYEQYTRLLGKSMGYGYLGNLLDYASDDVDNVLLAELEKRVFSKVSDKRTALETLVALTTPEQTTYPNLEHREFLKLAVDVFKDKKAGAALLQNDAASLPAIFASRFPTLSSLVRAHHQKWQWLSFLFVGPPKWTESYFYGLLAHLAQTKENPEAELTRLQGQPKSIIAARKKAAGRVQDDAYFYAARQLAYLKAMRKDAQVHTYFYLDGFFKHLARQFGISPTQARFHTSEEIIAILRGNQEPDPTRANRRFKECFFSTYHGKIEVHDGVDAAKRAEKIRRPQVLASDQIKGTCACPGTASGTVKVVNTVEEAGKVLPGDILVSYATNPELVSAMRKAAAIVTDMGGLTCHAAIVSRELNIPCVIGTKNATAVLKDGDRVEVIADDGIVRKL
ncbi:MAG: PEP-utilizing enzyme [Candidatus Micrarchaeota archaeon]|nr:PEP-utilizing enzyme [Candidatus Micrarchaeota archaeon]